MADNAEMDIVGTCREILLALLGDKTPEDVQAMLTGNGVAPDDAQTLINVTIATAQEVGPVLEGKSVQWQAVDALVKQGVEKPLAESLVKMVIVTMNARQGAAAGGDAPAAPATPEQPSAPVVNEAQMKILMRLALVVDADLQRGVSVEGIAKAIENIPDVADYPDVAGRAVEFVDNVRLARAACNLAQTGSPLQSVIADLGIDRKQPYVALLAVFFSKLTASPS